MMCLEATVISPWVLGDQPLETRLAMLTNRSHNVGVSQRLGTLKITCFNMTDDHIISCGDD